MGPPHSKVPKRTMELDPPHSKVPKRTMELDPPYPSLPKRPVIKDCGGPSHAENLNTKKTPPKLKRTTEPEKKNKEPSSSHRNGKEEEEEESLSLIYHEASKKKVKDSLRLFQTFVRKSTLSGNAIPMEASEILKRRGKFVHRGKRLVGYVPGIEVGQEFQYFEMLNVVGLHGAINGIDYVGCIQRPIATSVVSCRLYDDDLHDAQLFITTGEQGNVINNQNQYIQNLALIRSFQGGNHVRVIIKLNGSVNGAEKYCYYGVYKVVHFEQEIGESGYKFRLEKLLDQKKIDCNELRKFKQIVKREKCLHFLEDISKGKENFPIPAIDCIDVNSVPPVFEYITRMIYPEWCVPLKENNARCSCVGNCSDSDICYCAKKNGGKFPFNWDRTIEATIQDMVYECGPSCTCFRECRNRVSQNGIKFPLEIFKTKTKGWGVQSKKKIPSGSFVCEYLGEIIEDNKAVKMIGKHEYLFNIGNENHKDGVFTIDAAMYGNVARFINHSCSPNLVGQNVLFDHDDGKIPHIMFFAVEDIPQKTELTYNYNYKIDQVVDNGIVKRKDCRCGTSECVGRMY